MTKRQNERLQAAVDGLPCKLAQAYYFDHQGDACIIGHLSQYAPAAANTRKSLEYHNGTRIGHLGRTITDRLQRAFGLSYSQLTELQGANDSGRISKHARCLKLRGRLLTILKRRTDG